MSALINRCYHSVVLLTLTLSVLFFLGNISFSDLSYALENEWIDDRTKETPQSPDSSKKYEETEKTIAYALEAIRANSFFEARQFLSPLVHKGHTGATAMMADMIANGWGQKKDAAKAFTMYQETAYKNCPLAQYRLGNSYSHGVGTDINFIDAWAWYGLAMPYIRSAQRFQKLIGGNLTSDQISVAQERMVDISENITQHHDLSDRIGCYI